MSSNLAGSVTFSHSGLSERAHFVPAALGLVSEAAGKQSATRCSVAKRATSQLARDSRAAKSRRHDAGLSGVEAPHRLCRADAIGRFDPAQLEPQSSRIEIYIELP